MSDSSITHRSGGGITFAGPDAVRVYQAAALSTGIGLLAAGIKPRRDWTMTRALAACKQYTGQTYRRTEHERARRDLRVWIETMKSAIPTEVRS